ncbi:ammonium transporter [Asticcacaulis sp. EMRT-3]|uniref:ammonium transporter n=1 Tax=Asticcacaulis sp. EMRT-3 TaxID=3040349 RepID=UPI0024AFC37C|nr:ammonium transporter [Asticcacaulis sp. EMRT-3]MDI7774708.1 ammonium transporter [Asticcacaulis sp. EMRT-3]
MKTWIKLSRVLAAAATLLLVAPAASFALAQDAAPAASAVASASDSMMSASAEVSTSASADASSSAAAPVVLKSQAVLTSTTLSAANTTYLIFCTAMVLMMTLPGLALFYGGMVRRKNIIATVTQSVGVTCVVAIVWWVVSYSMAFGTAATPIFGIPADTLNLFFGGFDNFMLKAVTPGTAYASAPTIPEYTWISYQMTFAIITPALITGAFAERVKFSGLLLFMVLWSILVYAPICHMAWGGGIMAQHHVLDFAGGAVVHCNSGVAGLVCALFLGRRKGYGTDSMPANNPIYIMIGASLLFVGWIGFNAGSEWAGDTIASAALLNTILATCMAGVSWKIVEWIFRGKPSLIGILSGMVAGLVVITPACGFVNPTGAMICGLLAGPVCYASATWVKKLLGYDDSLDAFGIHGAGGFLGAVLTGWLADPAINSAGAGHSVMAQLFGLGITIAWSAIGTLIILIICKYTTGLRVTADEEEAGLDASLHDEVMDH